MLVFLLLVLLQGLPFPVSASIPHYCFLARDNSLCQFSVSRFSPACGQVISSGISQSDKTLIVSLHNEYRRQIAKGLETRGRAGPQRPAANMMAVVWDDELASMAQAWVNQCQYGHDTNRNVARFRVGQNLGLEWSTRRKILDWRRVLAKWYNEVKDIQTNVFGFGMSSVGHFTQMIWGTSSRVGCATIEFKNSNVFNYYYVCNYGPTGNFIGKPFYTFGRPCSACPAGTICVDGLCFLRDGNG